MPDKQTTIAPFYMDAVDIVLRGIDADMKAGRCWACRCEAGQPHKLECPERNANAE